MSIALLLLDLSISLYQAICFLLYGIGKVRRCDYLVIDHQHLAYVRSSIPAPTPCGAN